MTPKKSQKYEQLHILYTFNIFRSVYIYTPYHVISLFLACLVLGDFFKISSKNH